MESWLVYLITLLAIIGVIIFLVSRSESKATPTEYADAYRRARDVFRASAGDCENITQRKEGRIASLEQQNMEDINNKRIFNKSDLERWIDDEKVNLKKFYDLNKSSKNSLLELHELLGQKRAQILGAQKGIHTPGDGLDDDLDDVDDLVESMIEDVDRKIVENAEKLAKYGHSFSQA
jgi:DNA gyrase/topoisomerase IV subunit A